MVPTSFPLLFSVLLSWFATTAWAQNDPSFWTSWVPLAVRSPYLSTWMNTTNIPFNASNVDGVLRAPTIWPQFLQGQVCNLRRMSCCRANYIQSTGWAGMVRIDQMQTFKWIGDILPGSGLSGLNRTILTNIQVTPTRTIMNIMAGPLDLTVTFLSPIEVRALYIMSI